MQLNHFGNQQEFRKRDGVRRNTMKQFVVARSRPAFVNVKVQLSTCQRTGSVKFNPQTGFSCSCVSYGSRKEGVSLC